MFMAVQFGQVELNTTLCKYVTEEAAGLRIDGYQQLNFQNKSEGIVLSCC